MGQILLPNAVLFPPPVEGLRGDPCLLARQRHGLALANQHFNLPQLWHDCSGVNVFFGMLPGSFLSSSLYPTGTEIPGQIRVPEGRESLRVVPHKSIPATPISFQYEQPQLAMATNMLALCGHPEYKRAIRFRIRYFFCNSARSNTLLILRTQGSYYETFAHKVSLRSGRRVIQYPIPARTSNSTRSTTRNDVNASPNNRIAGTVHETGDAVMHRPICARHSG